jgi:hypothetical protein
MSEFDRRTFLGLTAAAAVLPASTFGQPTTAAPRPAEPYAGFPRQDAELVRETVGASHRDVARVTELVERSPALANATWDWGFGDWETALGAASHVGNREIAAVLLAHGARPTLFSAAMLGQLSVVRAFVEAHPGVQRTTGPHGITLLAHARAGGEDAAAVREYLEKIGDADRSEPEAPLAPAEFVRFMGSYSFGTGAEDVLTVAELRGRLGIARTGMPGQVSMTHLGDGAFRPAGAPAVRIRFEIAGEEATALRVFDPDLIVTARRVAG